MPHPVPAILEPIVQQLARQFDPDQIILFGSHARGDAGPDSDLDLLVVLPVTGRKADLELAMRLAVHDLKFPKDIVILTPAEAARQRHIPGTLARLAWLEGHVLYSRPTT